MNQDKFNGAVCVGSCGLYRRTAVEPFGGVAPISHSEDMYTGFKMTELGYKVEHALSWSVQTSKHTPTPSNSFFLAVVRAMAPVG